MSLFLFSNFVNIYFRFIILVFALIAIKRISERFVAKLVSNGKLSTVSINGSYQVEWHLESNVHRSCQAVPLLYWKCHIITLTDYQMPQSKKQNAYIFKSFHLLF